MTSSANRIDRDDYHPFRVGRRLIVVPAWLDPELGPDLIPIRIDPGTTFGTGMHATTKLCMAAIERHLKPGDSVLDLGTGSGILAIAAAELGASSVLALDTDPESVHVACKNVEFCGLAKTVHVQEGSLANVVRTDNVNADPVSVGGQETQAGLVVANILSKILIGFFSQGLTEVVEPGGLLILSGILRSQTPEINAALRRNRFEKLAQEQMEDWVCIIARRL